MHTQRVLISAIAILAAFYVRPAAGYAHPTPESYTYRSASAVERVSASIEVIGYEETRESVLGISNWGEYFMRELNYPGGFHAFWTEYLADGNWRGLFHNDPEICDEVEAIAEVLDIPLEKVYEAHACYEWQGSYAGASYYEGACSTAVVKIFEGLFATHIAMIRSDEWLPESFFPEFTHVRTSAVSANMKGDNTTLSFVLGGWGGGALGLTNWNDHVTVTINTRWPPWVTMNEILEHMASGVHSSPLTISRQIAAQCSDFDCALEKARYEALTGAAYISVVSSEKGCVIVREADGVVDERCLSLDDSHLFIYQDNCDWWDLTCYTLDPRASAIPVELASYGPMSYNEAVNFPWGMRGYPFRRDATARIIYSDNYLGKHESTVTNCTTGKLQMSCDTCNWSCNIFQWCDEKTGTCKGL